MPDVLIMTFPIPFLQRRRFSSPRRCPLRKQQKPQGLTPVVHQPFYSTIGARRQIPAAERASRPQRLRGPPDRALPAGR